MTKAERIPVLLPAYLDPTDQRVHVGNLRLPEGPSYIVYHDRDQRRMRTLPIDVTDFSGVRPSSSPATQLPPIGLADRADRRVVKIAKRHHRSSRRKKHRHSRRQGHLARHRQDFSPDRALLSPSPLVAARASRTPTPPPFDHIAKMTGFPVSSYRRSLEKPVSERNPLEHLFLRQSLLFVEDFFIELTDRLQDRKLIAELVALRDSLYAQVIGKEGIYKNPDVIRPFSKDSPVYKTVLESDFFDMFGEDGKWGRQNRVTSILKKGIYQALARFKRRSEQLGRTVDIAKVHYETIVKMATVAQNKLSQDGRIFIGPTPRTTLVLPDGRKVSYYNTLEQLAYPFQNSLAKRDERAAGINVHRGSMHLVMEDGEVVSNHEWRTGAFDYPLVKADPELMREFILNPTEVKTFYEVEFAGKSQSEREQKIKMIRKACVKAKSEIQRILAVKRYHLMAEALEYAKQNKIIFSCPYFAPHRNWGHEIKKYRDECALFINEIAIIRKNASVFRDVYHQAQFAELGVTVPRSIRRLFGDNPHKKVAMVSLQTPLHVDHKGWRNKLYLQKFTTRDHHELQPIFREMRGFHQVQYSDENMERGLYINIPTNWIGRNDWLWRGNSGTISRARFFQIQEENQRSLNWIYKETQRRIEIIDNEVARLELKINMIQKSLPELDIESQRKQRKQIKALSALRKDYLKYQQNLKDLSRQIFKPRPDSNGNRILFGSSGVYEVPARLNLLLKILGFSTTFHCRSGNNRTAAMAAKSHQLALLYYTSKDGHLPECYQLDGQREGRPDRHWSSPVYMDSLRVSLKLQKANKGTEGTKLKVGESISAFTTGAFKLADKFSKKAFEQAEKTLA